jgi:hypothetical protein
MAAPKPPISRKTRVGPSTDLIDDESRQSL